jgi:folate-dependent tRNA-U54 methylase TrmFO/GidA
MANETIGKKECPNCGLDGDVRLDKHGKAYFLCNDEECGYQAFTRRMIASEKMKAKMRPIMLPESPPMPEKKAVKKPEVAHLPTPLKPKGFLDGFFED